MRRGREDCLEALHIVGLDRVHARCHFGDGVVDGFDLGVVVGGVVVQDESPLFVGDDGTVDGSTELIHVLAGRIVGFRRRVRLLGIQGVVGSVERPCGAAAVSYSALLKLSDDVCVSHAYPEDVGVEDVRIGLGNLGRAHRGLS